MIQKMTICNILDEVKVINTKTIQNSHFLRKLIHKIVEMWITCPLYPQFDQIFYD